MSDQEPSNRTRPPTLPCPARPGSTTPAGVQMVNRHNITLCPSRTQFPGMPHRHKSRQANRPCEFRRLRQMLNPCCALSRPVGGAVSQVGVSIGQLARQSRTLLPRREVLVQASHDALRGIGQEHRPALLFVWPGQSGAGAQASWGRTPKFRPQFEKQRQPVAKSVEFGRSKLKESAKNEIPARRQPSIDR